jgi:hypothetical protein
MGVPVNLDADGKKSMGCNFSKKKTMKKKSVAREIARVHHRP